MKIASYFNAVHTVQQVIIPMGNSLNAPVFSIYLYIYIYIYIR